MRQYVISICLERIIDMSTIENIFDDLAIKVLSDKANKRQISECAKEHYARCKPNIGNMGIEQFVAFTATPSAGRSGIGEEAQILMLKRKYPKIIALPKKGKDAIRLWKNKDGSLFAMNEANAQKYRNTIDSSLFNVECVKSFDALKRDKPKSKLFVLKTTDIGSASKSTGGGHQKNVKNELITIIDYIDNNNVSFYGKKVDIIIIVDGRSDDNILASCKTHIKSDCIILGKCETI